MGLTRLIDKYNRLGISEVLDHEKFNHISIVHHSTRIEGSTLTEVETQVLINEGLTPKGKPLQDSLMVTDHFEALQFTLQNAHKSSLIGLWPYTVRTLFVVAYRLTYNLYILQLCSGYTMFTPYSLQLHLLFT